MTAIALVVLGGVVAHDLLASRLVAGSGSGLLCERADGSVWRDPSMGCGYWEDPRCRHDEPCNSSRAITEAVVETGAWFWWTDRRLTGPDPSPAGDTPPRDE